MRAGDILILVRKRAPFAAAMISALKMRGIKVAGADRLVLTEQIAVQDLMALGDFLVLPEDDLALAAVLKSPLLGLDDDDLLALAPKRQGSLWQELVARAGADARFAEAAETLKRWRARAEQAAPFEFYAGLLDGEDMRARMLARLGAEAADAIDELLNLALAYDDGAPPSLQGFLSWLRDGTREVKRDMEQGNDEVRVMTVHGAKGLEAPIVFLPDTCSTRSGRWPGSLLKLDDAERPTNTPPPFLWPVKGTSDLEVVQQANAAVARAETEERNRLLYVALTRARDRLYVAGFEGRNAPPPDCWYNLIRDGLADHLREAPTKDGRVVWRLASAQTAKPEPSTAKSAACATSSPLPAWAKTRAPRAPLSRIPLAPSRLAPLETDAAGEPVARPPGRLAEPPTLPPTALAEDSRFLRGTLTHALLEHLPALPQRGLGGGGRGVRGASGRTAAAQSAQEHRRGDSGRAARSTVCAAVRPHEPRRGGDRCRCAGPPRSWPGPAARRQDRPPGAGRQYDLDRRLQDQPATAEGCCPGCGGLPPATCRLPAGRAAHLSRLACQGCHSVDRRPENHGDSRGRARRPNSSGSGNASKPTLTLEGCLPTFPAPIPTAAVGDHPRRLDPMPGATFSVSDADFDKEVLKSTEPVLVDFFAEWCGPCKAMAPALEQVAAEMKGKVKVAKLDVDQNPQVTQKYTIQAMPTLMIFKGGEKVAERIGALTQKKQLQDWINGSI